MPPAATPQSVQGVQDDEDEELIQQALDPQTSLDFNRDLEPGEKAEDAMDFEDLSDNDLADDDEPGYSGGKANAPDDFAGGANFETRGPGYVDEAHAEKTFDDLFGEETFASIKAPEDDHTNTATENQASWPVLNSSLQQDFPRAGDTDRHQLQQELFALSRSAYAAHDGLPEPPTNRNELLTALWPNFEHGSIPKFMNLLPPKKARHLGKHITKPPRPLNPTKVNLEVAQDQEKAFRVLSEPQEAKYSNRIRLGLVATQLEASDTDSNESDLEDDDDLDSHIIHGTSWHDLQILCEDWNDSASSGFTDSETIEAPDSNRTDYINSENFDSAGAYCILEDVTGQPHRQKDVDDVLRRQVRKMPSVFEPELSTTHVAKKAKLDLNDPHLLFETVPTSRASFQAGKYPGQNNGNHLVYPKSLSSRYNISNDDAYDLLKENHQHKIRGMLNTSHVEHSMAAIRLQWPFYKTRLDKQELRAFHRPRLRMNRQEQISFEKPNFVKRKHTKGKDARTLFFNTRDLSLSDNSTALLLEYSEEFPTMLSNLGMGNKVINYYRKRSTEDSFRPRMDIGELHVLLPQDKSPFSLFGHVDPGKVTPAIHNAMYRAPIYKHEPTGSDFLVVRDSTGVEGSSWFLRNVEHLHVVGQEFPLVDVPGPHSRKVTTAAKNRLRMISYRIARKNRNQRMNVSSVTTHFMATTDMQIRQKMKDFMTFDRDHKEWRMQPGESIPDEDIVRAMVKPEEVCLLESMQVGQQHLQDSGFSKDDDDESAEENTNVGENIEQLLAPWFTSRNFLNASQGKAMLKVHGDGDPSGRGEAFSFIKTSMKGGFRAVGESVAERLRKQKMKDSDKHGYNVQDQQDQYEESIRRVWDAQQRSLSSTLAQPDSDKEDEGLGETSEDLHIESPRSGGRNSGAKPGWEDDSASQSTKWSATSQAGRIMEISRVVHDRYGNEEEVKDIIRNPRVIRQYLRRRRALDSANEDVLDIKLGEDAAENKRKEQRLKKELARLERNKDRRIARDKQKGIYGDGNPDGDGSPTSPGDPPAKTGVTKRKCANCGLVGHIKTNKK
ncbi:uncharacterized protein KY384_002500 [Bacidia gigantensis]|uniref:uncharacterized protein n=1 Tax=Bacidia gigantensis TaxID=2732470 RepID=UPI001D058439|nr:uncharacterized protein KY384_002500 [Bacidia gigantensis]KAG8532623.1 hypothetical protein KY384_002500 [Bacidia gigantensis]